MAPSPAVAPTFDQALRRKMLLLFLAIMSATYAMSTVSVYWLDEVRSDGRGEAIALTLAAVGLLTAWRAPLRGRRYVAALLCVNAAPVVALLFHQQIAAQVWAVIPLMFTAVFIRTWHTPAVTRTAVAVLAGAAVAALLIAPAPVPALWLVFYVLCIGGAVEVFGLANTVLLDAALRDPLTSVWNRAGLVRHANQLLDSARRRNDQVAVVVFDVDDFKGVNDRDGHAAGDQVLTDLARHWQAVLPPQTVLGRLGGDEFVMVLRDCDEDSVRALATELVDGHAVDVTFGVAVGSAATASFESLCAAADEDLYQRKRARRR